MINNNLRPISDTVEGNAEVVMREFYGADDAVARVVEETENHYTLEVWYEGDLRTDPRAHTYEGDDGRVQLFGIGEQISDNQVQMYATHTTPEALHYDLDQALPIEPLVNRYNLTPTGHDRVWVKNGSPGESVLEQCQRIVQEFPVRVVVSQTGDWEESGGWGYLSGYNLVTVSYESTLSRERMTETIEELRERLE